MQTNPNICIFLYITKTFAVTDGKKNATFFKVNWNK